MFGRKILFLAAWYVAGNVVASIYNGNKKPGRKSQSKKDAMALVDSFIDTHKNFISWVEKKYLSKETQKKLAGKKKGIAKIAKKYIQEGKKVFEDIQKNQTVASWTAKAKKAANDLNNKWRVVLAKAWEKLKKNNEDQF